MPDDFQSPREKERSLEDKYFKKVIIVRNDESLRHPDDTLEKAIAEGVHQHERTSISLFLSSISAGLIIGVSITAIFFSAQFSMNFESEISKVFIKALLYPLGFILCIFSGSQLYTEQTAVAVYPVLNKDASAISLIRMLSIVVSGNMVGTLISSILLSLSDTISPFTSHQAIELVLHPILIENSFQIILSSVLAGYLMAQAGWLVLSTPPSSIQFLMIYLVTFIIGICGFHHSIATSGELFFAILKGYPLDMWTTLEVLTLSILGNFLGGSIFVGILNFSHIRVSQQAD